MDSAEAGKLNSTIVVCLAVLFGLYWMWGFEPPVLAALGVIAGYVARIHAIRQRTED